MRLGFAFTTTAQVGNTQDQIQVEKAKNEVYFPFVKAKALDVMKAGFNAGDGYREVQILLRLYCNNTSAK